MAIIVVRTKLKELSALSITALVVLFCGIACALIALKPIIGGAVVAGIVGSLVALILFSEMLNGRVAPAILGWALLFPLGYYFVAFPHDKALITLDRLLPVFLIPAMAFARFKYCRKSPLILKQAAAWWVVFIVAASFSLVADDVSVQVRLLVDSFLLPMFLAWCVLRNFDVRPHLGTLHAFACLMALYSSAIGFAEIVTHEDVLALPGGALYFAGSLTRPNGPFYSDDSFALIGLITFFLLLFLRNAMGEFASWRKLLHALGAGAAMLMGLMPLFRSVFISLGVILLIETITTKKNSRRVAGIAILVFCVLSIGGAKLLAPDAFEDRSNPDNFYSRLSQQKQTLQVFLSQPFFGVGVGQFQKYVSGDSRFLANYQGVGSLNSPHNNLGGILSETGIFGLIPYVIAQAVLFRAFWKLRARQTAASQLVWKSFLYIFLSYWINGMTLASGYYSDLNLWYMFAIAFLYKYAMTEPQPRPKLESFSVITEYSAVTA